MVGLGNSVAFGGDARPAQSKFWDWAGRAGLLWARAGWIWARAGQFWVWTGRIWGPMTRRRGFWREREWL